MVNLIYGFSFIPHRDRNQTMNALLTQNLPFHRRTFPQRCQVVKNDGLFLFKNGQPAGKCVRRHILKVFLMGNIGCTPFKGIVPVPGMNQRRPNKSARSD